ncbi:zinc ribbon domain-containing protein [Halocatena halophila]|uniref:zinc ribbon domain-containing protein n=1 Tax=Halocatena halophila TaxID=2814576 RepID=UPI002ED6A274
MSGLPTIRAAASYTPSLRINADAFEQAWGSFDAPGIKSKAVPDADEDALTMAAEAGRHALTAASIEGEMIDWLGWATTTPPIKEEALTPRLKSMLAIDHQIPSLSVTDSTRAGTRLLLEAPADRTALVVVSDCPDGAPDDQLGHAAGAGATAFVLAPNGNAPITDASSYESPKPGVRFRQPDEKHNHGLDIGQYERRAFIDAIAGAGESITTADADAVAVQAPNGKRPYRVADSLGVDPATIKRVETVHELGDTGAASVPLGLTRALSDDCKTIIGASFGGGVGADVLRIEHTGAVPVTEAGSTAQQLSYAAYLRRREAITTPAIDTGAAHVSVPTWQRSIPQRHRLVAGVCPNCDALVFPPDGACLRCHELVSYEPVDCWTTGTIETVTTINRGGAPPEFATQQAQQGAFDVAIVALSIDGRSVSLPAQLTTTAGVGERVKPVIRHIYTQEGVPRYGVKFAPTNAER